MDLEIHYLDVGQGDCTLILFKEDGEIIRSVVIDCGGSRSFDIEEDVETQRTGQKLLDFCELNEVDHFDIWIITHWDKDHFAGFNYILQEANNQGGKAIRNMLQGTLIYDRGECFEFNKYNVEFNPSGMKNGKAPYKKFLENLFKLNNRTKDNPQMKRVTELVFGNYDRTDIEFSAAHFPNQNRYISSEPNKRKKFAFKSPEYLLAHDLLNWGFNYKIPDARLTCLAVNGFIMDGAENAINLDVANIIGLSTDIENRRSMGMLLQFGEFSCWFGGDLEMNIEDEIIPAILNRIGNLSLSVYKAPHHGSTNSTSEKILNTLQPDTVIVSSPPEKYEHPHPELIRRLALNKFVKKVFLTGSSPFLGQDNEDDSHLNTIIEDVTTDQVLGLTGEPIPDSDGRKFYISGGEDLHTHEFLDGHISLYVNSNNTNLKRIKYTEIFGYVVLDDDRLKAIEKYLDEMGNPLGKNVQIKVKNEDHYIEETSGKKRKRHEFASDEITQNRPTKKRRFQ